MLSDMNTNKISGTDGETPTPPPEDKLCTTKEIAAFLGVTEGHVYEMRRRSDMPYVKMGGSLRFYKPDVLDWARNTKNRNRKS
jgi:excisionase family DNA binding protein